MAKYIHEELVRRAFSRTFSPKTAREIVNAMPAADVVEVRHGEWKEWWPGDCSLIMTGEEMLWRCSLCEAKYVSRHNYCPNCGAKMDEEKDA